jgi:hypothetical protein
LSHYQAFCILWHLNRGDAAAAQLVAALPPVCFSEFDRMLEAAFALGMAANAKD